MGAIGGGVFQSVKGFRNAPVVSLKDSLLAYVRYFKINIRTVIEKEMSPSLHRAFGTD